MCDRFRFGERCTSHRRAVTNPSTIGMTFDFCCDRLSIKELEDFRITAAGRDRGADKTSAGMGYV